MRGRFLKSFGTVCLSILFVYSGVAWALENCLEEADASGEARAGYGERFTASADAAFGLPISPLNPIHHPITKIHCLVEHYQVGPMAQASMESRLPRLGEGVLLKTSPFGGPVLSSATKANFLWARFERFSPFPSLGALSRYLVLSVFRI
jgi:hypothetical protein